MKLPTYFQYEQMIIPVRSNLWNVVKNIRIKDPNENVFMESRNGVLVELEDRVDELEVTLVDTAKANGDTRPIQILLDETKENMAELMSIATLNELDQITSDTLIFVVVGDWLYRLSATSSEVKKKIIGLLETHDIELPPVS